MRIEETRISQTRCLESVFLLSYFRLRSSPSSWIWDMCALTERFGELRELAEHHATVPFGVRDILCVFGKPEEPWYKSEQ